MEILLKRIAKKSDYTIGKLFIGEEYFCDTLEPTWRNLLGVELPPEMVAAAAPRRAWFLRCSHPRRQYRQGHARLHPRG